MQKEIETIMINNVEYVRKDSIDQVAEKRDGLKYVIVRTYSAGVFAGYLKSRDGKEAVLLSARRLWKWDGAASLSQLAQSGTSKPEKCKFPEEVDEVLVTEAIEILNVTAIAKIRIDEVPVWIL